MCGNKYIIYNPYAENGKCKDDAEILEIVYDDTILIDMDKISNYKVFFDSLEKEDEVIICGGDGTLNVFVNAVREIDIKNDIYFFSVGYGYDFVRDLGFERKQSPEFVINSYIHQLPTLTVNGKERLFLNGVGFGVDGDCWRMQENMLIKNREGNRKYHGKDFFRIIKDAFSAYCPAKAVICVDGKEHIYEKVWMAPTMFGRIYNQGMIPAPKQKRMEESKQLSLAVLHGCRRWQAFLCYSGMYKKKYKKYRKFVTVLSGTKIKVLFDRPRSLVVDGEILDNVTGYSAAV